MTKQEIIKKEYGDNFESCKPDENGWCNEHKFIVAFGFFNEDYDETNHQRDKIRLKSLQGIEDNNGWIKIESESDLPKEKGNFYTMDRFYETNPCMEFFDPDNLVSMNERWMYRFTHYQPIIKPKPPIY